MSDDPLERIYSWLDQELATLRQRFPWMEWKAITITSELRANTTVEGGLTSAMSAKVGGPPVYFVLVCHFDKIDEDNWKFGGGWKFQKSYNQVVYPHLVDALQGEMDRLKFDIERNKALETVFHLHRLQQVMKQ